MLKLIDVQIECFCLASIYVATSVSCNPVTVIYEASPNKSTAKYNKFAQVCFRVDICYISRYGRERSHLFIFFWFVCVVASLVNMLERCRFFFLFNGKTSNLNTMKWLSPDINFFSLSSILLTNFYPNHTVYGCYTNIA